MTQDALESLVEQRIAKLGEISDRRNALLREMYSMMKKRTNVGAAIAIDEEEEDLHIFLNKYDLQKNPDSGYISQLPENELFSLVSPVESQSPPSASVSSRSRSSEARESLRRSRSLPAKNVPGTDKVVEEEEVFSSRQGTPAAPESPAHHTDSDDELDIIRSSPPPPLPPPKSSGATPPGSIHISDTLESTQVIRVGGSVNQVDEDNTVLDITEESSLVPPEVSAPPETLEDTIQPTETTPNLHTDNAPPIGEPEPVEAASMDAMEIDDTQAVLPSSPPVIPEAADPPDTAVSPTAEQSQSAEQDIPATEPDNSMDIDVEPIQIVVNPSELEPELAEPATPLPHETASLQEPPPPTSPPPPQAPLTVHPSISSTPEPFAVSLTPSSPVFIPVPSSSYRSISNDYTFTGVPIEPPSAPPVSPTLPRHQLDLKFTLPPLDSLPAEFNRKNKKTKQRKKEREREKAEGKKDKDGKDEWVPWGANRWNATLRINPVYKKVSKATKCLSTRDWGIAMTELKLIRTIDRIDMLKSKGRWSFRQPKKQRATGGVTKTHWDYLMDEMKWMRTDFREERKWKMALAYNLSTAVLEWHAAKTPEKRLKCGICVRWKPPKRSEQKDKDMEDVADTLLDPMELDTSTPATDSVTRPSSALLNLDYGSDEEDDEDQEKDVEDGLDPSTMVEEALTASEQNTLGEGIGFKDLQPKTEEVDDTSALQTANMDVEMPQQTDTPIKDASPEGAVAGLKSTSDDPLLLSKSTSHSSSEPAAIPHSKSSRITLYAPLREKIAHSEVDKLFLDLGDFRITTHDPSSSDNLTESLLPPSDLSDIFPDFQPYGMFDVIPPTVENVKKRSDKKSAKDDASQRIDEIAHPKLYPASKFMLSKPTLVGALQPSKHLREGRWVGLDETPILVEHEPPQSMRLGDEFKEGIFEYKVAPITIVTPAITSAPSSNPMQSPAAKFKEPSKRAIDHFWSDSDDLQLKTLAEKYPNNWELIAECYNASRITVRTDWRTSKDCQERWRERWSPAAQQQRLLESGSTPEEGTPPPTPQTSVSTRGVKRLASTSVSMPSAPTISTTGSGSEFKKRRRHMTVQDAIRKSVKKKAEASQKNSVRKPTGTHESHNNVAKLAKYVPAEMSRQKAEKDILASQQLAARARAQLGPNAQVRAPSAQAAPNGQVPAVNGVPLPSAPGAPGQPNVAQIRSQQVPISQQQRSATPMVAGTARMSPQQQQQLMAQQARAQAQNPAQAQAQLALSHAMTQAQVHAQMEARNAQQPQNGVNGNAQLSPPYTSRDATSSPAHASPPRSSATPSNGAVSSPRPSSAQAQIHPQAQQGQVQVQHVQSQQPVGMLQNGQIAAMNIPQARNVQGHYYLPNLNYTNEQLQNILQLQAMQQRQQQFPPQ